MDKQIDELFRQAKGVRLTADEKLSFAEAIVPGEEGRAVREARDTCHNPHMASSLDGFFSASQALRLSSAEKGASFAAIARYMREHPVRLEMSEPSDAGAASLLERLRLSFSSLRLMPALAFALLLLIGGGATSFAAEAALPGDALYPVKIHVNDGVRRALAASAEAEAELDARLTERRLAEARELAAMGSMDTELQERVAVSIETQVERTRDSIAALSEDDEGVALAAQASTRLQSALAANQNVFERISADGPTMTAVIQALDRADEVSAKIQSDLSAKLAVQSEAAVQAVAQKGIEAAQERMDAMKSYLQRKGQEFSADAKAEVEARLRSAQEAIADAQARLAEGAATQALGIAGRASADVQESEALGALQQFVKVRVNGGDSAVEIKTNGSAKPDVKVEGNGNVDVRINGERVTPASSSASARSSAGVSSSGISSAPSRVETDIRINQQQTTSDGSVNVDTEVNVNTENEVNVEGGGSVKIESDAGVNINSTVNSTVDSVIRINQ